MKNLLLQEVTASFYVGVIVEAYHEFISRVKLLSTSRLTKAEQIKELVKTDIGKIANAEIMEICPDISQTNPDFSMKTFNTTCSPFRFLCSFSLFVFFHALRFEFPIIFHIKIPPFLVERCRKLLEPVNNALFYWSLFVFTPNFFAQTP